MPIHDGSSSPVRPLRSWKGQHALSSEVHDLIFYSRISSLLHLQRQPSSHQNRFRSDRSVVSPDMGTNSEVQGTDLTTLMIICQDINACMSASNRITSAAHRSAGCNKEIYRLMQYEAPMLRCVLAALAVIPSPVICTSCTSVYTFRYRWAHHAGVTPENANTIVLPRILFWHPNFLVKSTVALLALFPY